MEEKMTGYENLNEYDRMAADAIRAYKEEGKSFACYADEHGMPRETLSSRVRRYRIRHGITERFWNAPEASSKSSDSGKSAGFVKVPASKPAANGDMEIVVEYHGARIPVGRDGLALVLETLRNLK